MKTQVVNNTEFKTFKIPSEILFLESLEKPNAKDEMDILKAYSDLYFHYKACEVQMSKIKDLDND